MNEKVITKSGVEITQDDVRDIQKKAARETVRNVLAIVGVGALIKIGRDVIDGRSSILNKTNA